MATTQFDQAIFTSIRTPTGEGYRIIAASAGLRADEKQSITRLSPSHNGLCAEDPNSQGANSSMPGTAFYQLPTGRLCVAYSCLAGAEHTARGGQRVYTQNLIFSAEDFRVWGWNPFAILRAMLCAGLCEPQLKPPPVFEPVELSPGDSVAPADPQAGLLAVAGGWGRAVLQDAMEGRRVVLNLEGSWAEALEVLMLGVPAQRRAEMSFAAGLHFTASRPHVITILSDVDQQAKHRLIGQPVTYVDATNPEPPEMRPSQWLTFVDRCWSGGELETLGRRTNCELPDVSTPGLERLGALFNEIDSLASKNIGELLDTIGRVSQQLTASPERELVRQLVDAAEEQACRSLERATWDDCAEFWPRAVSLLAASEWVSGAVQTIAERMLEAAISHDPIAAAEAAIELARRTRESSVPAGSMQLVDHALEAVAVWAEKLFGPDEARFRAACEGWRELAADCPPVARLCALADKIAATGSK